MSNPTYNLRILLETVLGTKTSYYSSGSVFGHFVNNDELVLSASTVYNRITSSYSASYQATTNFTGDINKNFVFKDNNLLSASLQGNENTGSIVFTSLNDEYDRLLRYKFIGDKVCTVLGLPSNQWVYVDQFRLPSDDEANIFTGNAILDNTFVSDTLTFANNANINSDIPIYIDTGSDRYMKFIDTRDTGKASLIFGYDKETDTYEITADTGSIFNIKNLNTLDVDVINAAVVNQVTSSTQTTVSTAFTQLIVTGSLTVSGSEVDEPLLKVSGSTRFGDPVGDTHQFTGSVLITGSTSPHTTALDVVGGISSSGDLILSNDKRIMSWENDGNNVQQLFRFAANNQVYLGDGDVVTNVGGAGVGNIVISGSGVGIGTSNPTKMLHVSGAISASAGIFLDSNTQISFASNPFTASNDSNPFVTDNYIAYSSTGDHLTIQSQDIFLDPSNPDGGVGINTDSPEADLHVVGKILSTDDITTQGDIIAQNYIVKSSVTEVTTSFSSGSTQFGNSGDDTHIFSGSLRVTGSGNHYIETGNVGIGTTTPQVPLQIVGGDDATTTNTTGMMILGAHTTTHLALDDNEIQARNASAANPLYIQNEGGNTFIGGVGKTSKVGIKTHNPTKELTVEGSISASGTLHISTINDANDEGASSDLTIDAANVLNIGTSQVDEINIGRQAGTNVDINFYASSSTPSMKIMNETVKFNHHITASANVKIDGNISASGFISTLSHITASGNISSSLTGSFGHGFFDSKVGIGTTSPSQTLTVEGDISASGDFIGKSTSTGSFGSVETSGNISASGIQHVLGGRLDIRAAANNTTLLKITDIDQQNNLNFAIDANQHSDLHIEKDGVDKIRFNTYWPAQIDNDSYETFGGLILGGEVDRSDKTGYGLYVSSGSDSGSAIFKGTNSPFIVEGNITASGNISASGTVFASAFSSPHGDGDIDFSDSLDVAGNITASGNISSSSDVIARSGSFDVISRVGDSDTRIYFSDDDINIMVGGQNMIDLTSGSQSEITFNEAGIDIDFRVEGDGDANLLFTNAGTDKVGIGTNSPSKKLTVDGAISASQNIFIGTGTGTDEKKIIHSGDEDTHLLFDQNKVNLVAGGSSVIKLEKSTGKIFINNSNHDLDTQIMDDYGNVVLHVDASGSGTIGRVGIGTTTPTKALQVTGDISASGNLLLEGGITASTDIVLDNYLDTALRFIDGTGGVTNNFIDYRRWVTSATGGKEITNTTGIIKLESKGVSNGLVISGSDVGIGTSSPSSETTLTVSGSISASGDLYLESTKKLYLNSVEDTYLDSDSTDRVRVVAGGQQMLVLDYDTGNRAAFGDTKVGIGGGDNHQPTHELEVDGVISSSGYISTESHITASGNISASSTGGVHTLGGKLGIGTLTASLDEPEGTLQVGGNIYGKKIHNEYSNLYRFGGLYFTWDSDTYGTNKHHSIRSTEDNTFTDSLTFNSYDKMMFNIDSNDNNDNSYFRIGHHGTGSSDSVHILDLDDEHDFTLYRSGSSTAGAGIINFHIDGAAGNVTASGDISASGTIQSTGDISALTSTGSFGRVQGTGSMTEMVLSQDIVTTLNSSVGTIDDGETISAGTSIEQILRNMLQDFVPPVFSSFSIPALDAYIEVGDTEPTAIDEGIFATASSTSHLTGFENNGGSFALSLSGNATSDGAISATYEGNSNGTISFTSPSSITVKRTTLGTVTFTLTGTDNNPVGANNVTTKTDKAFFRHPIFYGGSSNNTEPLNDSVLASILGDISSSVSSNTGTTGIIMQTTNDAVYGDQTLINTTVDDNLPTDMTLVLPSSVENLSNYTYIIYPVTYGAISQIVKNDSFDETDSFKLLGTANHQRFTGVNTTYRVYKSLGQGPFLNGDTLKIND